MAAIAGLTLWVDFGPFAIYPPIGFIDPWLYTGYFTNFDYLLMKHGFTYYVSRLPWIIPGRIAFAIAEPSVASLLLCLAIVTVSSLSLYKIIGWHYGRPPALLAVLALITNAYFMSTTGWQYPDGAAIAYAMVALAFYLRPRGSRVWNSVMGASMLTLSASTNAAGAPMIVSVLFMALWRWRSSRRELFRESICALSGAVITTLMLMVASKEMLGDARIFKPQMDIWLYAARHSEYLATTWGTGPAFLLTSVRLFTPAFLLLFGPLLLNRTPKPATIAWPCYFSLLICCSLYAIQEFVFDRAGLRVPYVSSYMLVPASCFAGIVFGEVYNRGNLNRSRVTLPALATLTMVLPSVYVLLHPLANAPRTWTALSCVALTAIALQWPKAQFSSLSCALVIIAVSGGSAMDPFVFSDLEKSKIFHGSNLSHSPRAEAFACLMRLETYLKANIDPERRVVFWWDMDDPMSPLFRSAESLFVSQHQDISSELSSGTGKLHPSNTTLVQFSGDRGRLAKHNQLLASRGLEIRNELRHQLTTKGEDFTVALGDLSELP
jgi:hypothetical protein